MTQNTLEHINMTVRDPDAVAATLSQLFDWHIRWAGSAKDDGYTVHVGGGSSYLALYTHKDLRVQKQSHITLNHLNHIGIVVNELDKIEVRIQEAGFTTFNHGDYEPGKRFYFMLSQELEVEVITYQ
jgi:hypothetical protein